MSRNIAQDINKLLEEYANMNWDDHGYINPHFLFKVVSTLEEYSTIEVSDNVHKLINEMWDV